MRFQASHRFARITPRKARLVVDQVRGRHVDEALSILRFSRKRAAGYIRKVIDSALANASNDFDYDTSGLYVVEARVDEGPILKRFIPRAMGRATPIHKKMCHINIVLGEKDER
ncbi:MAG: 50S ribosomal protein L22 [Planctomycetes bacterium]|nr:50S ribosomal protein L22 [Planctomycetota bacterium]